MSNTPKNDNIRQLFGDEERCLNLSDALHETIANRGQGMTLPSIIGTIVLTTLEMVYCCYAENGDEEDA